MIKAGALLYAMFLVIVISIITSSFILINYYNETYVLQAVQQEQLFKDVHSGINYGLAFHQQIPLNQPITISLFDDEQHEVTLKKKTWGAFYSLTVEANWRNKSANKTALVGANINGGEKTAIYLTDQNKPLAITGKTNIVGNCYLPVLGVKRAYIERKNYAGKTFVKGITKTSSKTLPPINKKLIAENFSHFSIGNHPTDSVIDYEVVMENDSIINSFQHKTLVLFSPYSIVLANKVIEGNIIIKSDRNIVIESSAILNDIICYAKGIVMEEKAKITGQFFVQDSIIVGDDCELNYPSVLALLGKGSSATPRKIMVGKNVVLKGSIFLYNENYDKKNQASIAINEDCKIMGEIYSSEQLEIRGEVKGGVFCKMFTLKTPSSVYLNHLMDVTIDRTALSEHFVGVALTEEINHHQLIKWLN